MQFIFSLIQKNKHIFLLCVLELIAFIFTIQLHSYHKSKFINSTNLVSGGVYNNLISLSNFFLLSKENKRLILENEKLYNLLESQNIESTDSLNFVNTKNSKFQYIAASIINNDYHANDNFITLDKGEKDGVTSDIAVVNSLGVIGIVNQTSKNYSVAISVLNRYFSTNAKLKNTPFFGTISWNGNKINIVQLHDIPRQAKVQVGDTIVTGGRSAIFPQGIPIGSVHNVQFLNNHYQNIDVKLFNDFRTISSAYLIKNKHQPEIKNLEKKAYE